MLYYIIPPIVIVISTSVLIYFLFKKAEQSPALDMTEGDSEQARELRLSRLKEAISHGWLKLLERVMHRAKLMSLKFHNISNERFHAIRKKRQEIIEQEKQEKEEKKEAEVSEKTRDIDVTLSIANTVEKDQRPLVKPDIVRPDSRQGSAVFKNQLEDVLIKRIAVNPRDIEAYERLGDYYMESSNQRDALECFNQVLKLNPSHHKARLRVRRIEAMMKEK